MRAPTPGLVRGARWVDLRSWVYYRRGFPGLWKRVSASVRCFGAQVPQWRQPSTKASTQSRVGRSEKAADLTSFHLRIFTSFIIILFYLIMNAHLFLKHSEVQPSGRLCKNNIDGRCQCTQDNRPHDLHSQALRQH